MMKKHLFLLIVCLLTACLVAACSNGAAKTVDTSYNQPATLVFYTPIGGISEDNFNLRAGDAIRKKFPNYTIKYIPQVKGSALADLVTAGQTIDVFWDGVGNNLAQFNMQYDMTDLIKKHNVDLSRIDPTLLDGERQANNGANATYGLPVAMDDLVLFYNKDLFDKFGVSYPTNGMTWDQVLDLSKKLTRVDNGTQYVGLSFSQTHMLWLNPYSIPYVDPKTGKPTINTDPRWKKIYQLFLDASSDPGYQQMVLNQLNNKFPYDDTFEKDKTLGMLVTVDNRTIDARFIPVNWDMVSMPFFSDLPGVGTQPIPYYYSIPSNSQNKDAAMEVIKYLLSDEYQLDQAKKNNTIPVLVNQEIKKAIGQENSQIKGKNASALVNDKFAAISYQSPYNSVVQPIYANMAVQLIERKMDMNTLFNSIEDQANKAIETFKQSNSH